MKWNTQNLRNLQIQQGKTKRTISDPETHGLYFEVRSKRRSFIFRGHQNGKSFSHCIGHFPDISIAEARRITQQMRQKNLQSSRALRMSGVIIDNFVRDQFCSLILSRQKEHRSQLRLYENHIAPTFGQLFFHEITREAVKKWGIQLNDNGLKPSTQNRIRILFGQIFKLAEELDIPGAPDRKSLDLRQLRVFPSHVVFLTPQEVSRLKAAIEESSNPNLADIVTFLLLTGARKRECLDAKWSHINLISQQWLIPISKTGRPRHIQLSKVAMHLLARRRKADISSEYIFPNPSTGLPYRCIHHSWKKAREVAELPQLRIHDLRHSFASALVNSGATLYDVQHLLGHSSIKTTQRYAHLSRDRLQRTVSLIDGVYG